MRNVMLLSCWLFLCVAVAALGRAEVACVCVCLRARRESEGQCVHLRGWAGQELGGAGVKEGYIMT